VAWLGQAPFTEQPHVFANLGDGTYIHSGILAIRAAVAAEARITYKLLFNGAVAMTGGQTPETGMGVPEITRQLAAEGVTRIVVVSEDMARYADRSPLAAGVDVRPRSELDAVQRELREFEGVSVLVYDQACAAEARRKRKRGLVEDPSRRIFINELVCEGCGDCSAASNCLSVEPSETEFGRKRRINQSTCNKDYSCADGSCPAFVSVIGGELRGRPPADFGTLLDAIPAPLPSEASGVYNVVLTGVGGTGVTTTAALVGMAAHIEGRASAVLDMTGLAQKGGAVVSHVRLADHRDEIHGSRVPEHGADLLLGCDLVVAAGEQGLGVLDTVRSRAVLNTHVAPTAAFVMDNEVRYDGADMADRVRQSARELYAIDATHAAEGMLGDAIGSNVFLLGYAFQLGLVPLRLESIEAAIELNGVAVEMNERAFALGRMAAHDAKVVEDWSVAEQRTGADQTLDDLIRRRTEFLTDYQDAAWADDYRSLVDRVRAVDAELGAGSRRLTTAVARGLFKLMAYKDEYEVARLYTNGAFQEALSREFTGDYRVALHLAPPAFARRDPATGRLVKRAYGAWIFPAMRVLARLKCLRGTPFDPFGYMAERRTEREMIAEYREAIEHVLRHVAADRYDRYESACALAELPSRVRGFDRVRAPSIAAMREARTMLLAEIGGAG
jgi:indolepyruvate ferredoxin oxidoreductase